MSHKDVMINKSEFTKDEDRRMSALAKLTDVYFTEDQYENMVMIFDIETVYGFQIKEIGSCYTCRFPSLTYARTKSPFSYKWLLEGINGTIEENNGVLNLRDLVGRKFIITIQKKTVIDKGYNFFNLLNLIDYCNDVPDKKEEGVIQ